MNSQTPAVAFWRGRSWLLPVLVAVLFVGAQAQNAAEPGREVDSDLEVSHFNLIPKAFLRNPTLEMTVFTELTDYGRTFAPATLAEPVYYESSDLGLQSRGFAMAGDTPLPREEMLSILQRSLTAGGYRPAEAGHRPELALVFFWGSHNSLDPDLARQFPELAQQYILERAVLVGGKAYAGKLAREFNFGDTDMSVSGKKEFLRMQTVEDLYYVVVSAYAYADLARNEHRLLWRTTMTVNTRGVSMKESLPPLVVTAADYFGRPTTEPIALRRAVHRGTVKLGPMEILEPDVPASTAAPTNSK